MKYILSFLLCLSITVSKADAWDNLKEKEAKKTVKFLKKNPYIIDYCDCCTGSEAYLLKVVSAEIVTCDWNSEDVSIKLKVKKVARLETTGSGISKYRAEPINSDDNYKITMNYTFGFDKKMKWAVPLFKLVDYGYYDNHICMGAGNYPEPTLNDGTVINKDYQTWYNKYIAE